MLPARRSVTAYKYPLRCAGHCLRPIRAVSSLEPAVSGRIDNQKLRQLRRGSNVGLLTAHCNAHQFRIAQLLHARHPFVQLSGLIRLQVRIDHLADFGRFAGGERQPIWRNALAN